MFLQATENAHVMACCKWVQEVCVGENGGYQETCNTFLYSHGGVATQFHNGRWKNVNSMSEVEVPTAHSGLSHG